MASLGHNELTQISQNMASVMQGPFTAQCLKQAVAHSLNSNWLSGERPQIVCGQLKISMVI